MIIRIHFWSQYTDFNHKIYPFESDELIWGSEDSFGENSHLWHQKYSLSCTQVVDFVACRVTSKILGIDAARHSWGDIKKSNPGKIPSLSSDIHEKHSIFYTSSLIEYSIIGRTLSISKIKYSSHSLYLNDAGDAFAYQLDKWGV